MGKKWVIFFSIILFLCIVLLSVKFLTKSLFPTHKQTQEQNDLPPKKWTQRRVGFNIETGS